MTPSGKRASNTVCSVSTVPFLLGDRVLWHPRNLPDEMMIAGIYVTMGIVMIAAAPNPRKHKAFVDFVILANLLHAAIMAATARNILQVIVDVIPIAAMGSLPLIFYPWAIKNYLRQLG